MTRKAVKRRNTGDQAAETLFDYVHTPAPALTMDDRRRIRAGQPDRAEALLAYKPRSTHKSARTVVELIVDLVLRIEFASIQADRTLMKIGFRYGLYCVDTYGEFDPVRHLLEVNIERWAMSLPAGESAKSTWKSGLRRLRRGRRYQPKFSRNVAETPYTDEEWAPLERLRLSQASKEATAVLTLSGKLGLRAREIVLVTGNWVHVDGDKTWITVPDKDGVIRLVPAFGFTAQWLREQMHAGPDYVLRPHRSGRDPMIWDVLNSIRRQHGEVNGFKVNPARNMFVTDMLRRRIPLRTIYSVAGLSPGSTLPGDLIAFLDDPSPEAVYRHMDSVYNRGPKSN